MHGHLHGHKGAQTTNVLNIQTLQRKECFHMLCRCINKLNQFIAKTQHFQCAVELRQQKFIIKKNVVLYNPFMLTLSTISIA